MTPYKLLKPDKRPSKRLKGKKLWFTSDVVGRHVRRRPMTRYATKKEFFIQEDTPKPSSLKLEYEKIEEIPKVTHHKQKTIELTKDLKSQLKKAQETIAKLLEENRKMRVSISDHMDLYQDALFKPKIMVKKTLPLHRQAKNL